MFTCRRCPGLTFESVGAREVHTRALHRKACTVREADGTKIIVRVTPCGKWRCPYPSCSVFEHRSDRLQKHYAIVHVRNAAAAPARDLVPYKRPRIAPRMESEEDLDTPEIFGQADFFVVQYQSMTLLLCKTCNVIIDGTKGRTVVRHVEKDFREGQTSRWSQQNRMALFAALQPMVFTPLQRVTRFFKGQAGPVSPV
ncbi:unnamed protein product [Calypogeia fissa]